MTQADLTLEDVVRVMGTLSDESLEWIIDIYRGTANSGDEQNLRVLSAAVAEKTMRNTLRTERP